MKTEKIFVTGPAAHSMIMLNGAWTRTWQGTDEKWDDTTKFTIYEALKALNPNVTYAQGVDPLDNKTDDKSLEYAAEADVIIVCLGEYPSTEKVGDIDDLSISQTQIDYFKSLHKLNKKIILVLVENRPRLVNAIADLADAVVMAYQPGDYGGKALASILYGDVNPSGKLPLTYPRFNQSLLTYDHKYTETIDQKFGNNAFNPQWEFGHGLSYSDIVYSDLKVSSNTITPESKISVSVRVSNQSNLSAKESVLLFTRDHFATITPSAKLLKGFEKIDLNPNESKVVTFELTEKQLQFIHSNGKPISEVGEYDVMIGNLKTTITLQK